MSKSILECVLCDRRFCPSDVESGEYCVETMICFHCYAEMQAKPHKRSCFGKPTSIFFLHNGRKQRALGYNENAEECQNLCPDRVPCRKVVLGLLTGKKGKN